MKQYLIATIPFIALFISSAIYAEEKCSIEKTVASQITTLHHLDLFCYETALVGLPIPNAFYLRYDLPHIENRNGVLTLDPEGRRNTYPQSCENI